MEFDLGEGAHHVYVGGVNAEMELPASFNVLPREDQVQAQLAADFFQRIVAAEREGSKQSDLWGGGIDLETRTIDFNSFINIRPGDHNTSNEIQSESIRKTYEELTKYFFKELYE
jgi:hypothetical protein